MSHVDVNITVVRQTFPGKRPSSISTDGLQAQKYSSHQNCIIGSSTPFQKIGKGTASTKARHGKVPVMNVDHEPVECQLTDFYAGDWVDKLDEIKTNVDERTIVTHAGAHALRRKTDEVIIS